MLVYQGQHTCFYPNNQSWFVWKYCDMNIRSIPCLFTIFSHTIGSSVIVFIGFIYFRNQLYQNANKHSIIFFFFYHIFVCHIGLGSISLWHVSFAFTLISLFSSETFALFELFNEVFILLPSFISYVVIVD